MSNRGPLLPIAWDNTEGVRRSVAWWVAAVLSGAGLGLAAYYVVPSDQSWLWACAGVLAGFFAPYVLAIAWNLPRAAVRAREEEWAKVGPIVRRTR